MNQINDSLVAKTIAVGGVLYVNDSVLKLFLLEDRFFCLKKSQAHIFIFGITG